MPEPTSRDIYRERPIGAIGPGGGSDMPWRIEQRGDRFCVVNKDSGKSEKCHPSREQAKRHLQALYANVKDVQKNADGYPEVCTCGDVIKDLSHAHRNEGAVFHPDCCPRYECRVNATIREAGKRVTRPGRLGGLR